MVSLARSLVPPLTGPPRPDSEGAFLPGPGDLGNVMVAYPPVEADSSRLQSDAAGRPLWVPLILVTPPGRVDAYLHLLVELELLSPAGVSHLEWGKAIPPSADALLKAVNQRPPPSAASMALWLGCRLQRPGVTPDVRASMEAPSIVFARRTHHRHIRNEWGCRPSALKRLAHLACLPRLHHTVERLASAAGTTATRLRERVQAGLGISLVQFNRMPGWEVTLELAVRAGLGTPGWGLGAGRR